MDSIFPGAFVVLLGGAAVALLNFWLTKRKMERDPDGLPRFFLVRTALNVGYLALIYLLTERFGWEPMRLLLAAAIGLTVPSVVLAAGLSKNAAPKGKKGGKRK